ncbi:8-oxo-dGTP diphosphatase MutT [Luminiphilus sp. nBUS_16]|uniref:8-oxo-dGTP diphosphatase MutT n=1 Tax=Luminiphilus sp. nBUS_16 TaxID=3395315 RepID=UPI003EC0E95C
MSELHVAVGVLTDAKGRILIARRPAELHQGGLWEFPGGKLEPGETLECALARELKEELGVTVKATEPLLEIRHDYGDREVFLDVHRVIAWQGEAQGMEGQPLAWTLPAALGDFDFPAANVAIVEKLRST